MGILVTEDTNIEDKDTDVQSVSGVEKEKTLYGYPEQTIARIDHTVEPPMIIFKDAWNDGLQTAIITDGTEEQDDEGTLLVESDEDTTESILIDDKDDVEESIIIG